MGPEDCLDGDFRGRTVNQRNGQRADKLAKEVDTPHLRIHGFEDAFVIPSNDNCLPTLLARILRSKEGLIKGENFLSLARTMIPWLRRHD
jgi:hypothetical protein